LNLNWQQGQIAYMVSDSGGSALYILNLREPENPVRIARSSSTYSFLGAQFSPDSSQIAYYQYKDAQLTEEELLLIEAQPGAVPSRLGSCRSPAWSCQGNQVICSSDGNIFIMMNISTGRIAQTLPGDIRGVISSWSSARSEIAYAAFEGKHTDILRASISTGKPLLLAGDSSENYAPAWSPDGNQIAYQSNQGSKASEIWIMDRSGENQRRLTVTPNGHWSRAPSWSPDGLWLAFVSSQSGSIGADYGEIFLVSVNTGELVQLTNTGGIVYDWRITWGR
jgi:Tol biopolymer transport system component